MSSDNPPLSIPIQEELLSLLKSFSSASQELFASITSNTVQASKSVSTQLNTLSSLDRQLADVVARLPQHASNQTRIQELISQIKGYDADWKTEVIAAEELRKDLAGLIRDGKRDRERIQLADKGQFVLWERIWDVSHDVWIRIA